VVIQQWQKGIMSQREDAALKLSRKEEIAKKTERMDAAQFHGEIHLGLCPKSGGTKIRKKKKKGKGAKEKFFLSLRVGRLLVTS